MEELEDDGFWGIPEDYEPYSDGCPCGYWQCSGCGKIDYSEYEEDCI